MSKQPLEEILEELKAAEVRWQELLKETGSATGNLKKNLKFCTLILNQ